MPKSVTQTGKLTKEMLAKFPNSSKRTIAALLHETYPQIFHSFEHARDSVKLHTRGVERTTVYDYGQTKCKDRQFVTLPTVANNILWLSDIHFPNHDKKALKAAIDYGKQAKINCIVLGGDILDNEPFTNHDAPPPGKYDVIEWFDMVEEFLQHLRDTFKSAKIVWLEGNHDAWYKRYLMKKAPILFNDEYYQLPQRLNLKEYGVEFLEQNTILKAGKLQMVHGHTLVRGIIAPVNPARGVFLRTKSSTIIGHVHQNSYHPERNLKGEIIGCWSVGCLCTLAPEYDPHNTKHGHGFAHIQVHDKGGFTVELKEIYNGKIL